MRRGINLPHKARSFAHPPGRGQAAILLDEIADATAAYAPVPADRPLALYGAGNLGRLARDFLKAVGQDFILAVDQNARALSANGDWAGVQLVHPDNVTDIDKSRARLAVSVVTSAYVPIERMLLDRGFIDVVPFYDLAESFRHLHPLSNGWFAAKPTSEDRSKTAQVLTQWSDDVSRAHHLQFLAWRRLREEWTFAAAPIPDCDRFFIPEIAAALSDDEVLIDGGAHHGVVAEAFLRHTKANFRRIVAIEPDPINRARLGENLQRLAPGDARIAIDNYALSDKEDEAVFHSGLDYASQISRTGNMRVKTRTIDALGLSPTLIKLHLEGAELAALKGARQTLLDCRPIVVTTIYHNDDGIWKTAAWLMEALSDYRFLFRNHSWCGTGAVIYAIPLERIVQT
jgi:FkbM family methyltransferase